MPVKTAPQADENYLEELAKQDKPALVTSIDEDFDLAVISIFNLMPGLTGAIPKDVRVVNYDFTTIGVEAIDEEVAEGIVQNIRMLLNGQIDGLNIKGLTDISYLEMANVDEIDVGNNAFLHWSEQDMQVLIDHVTLLGAKQTNGSKPN